MTRDFRNSQDDFEIVMWLARNTESMTSFAIEPQYYLNIMVAYATC